jgi:hypothetical protein
MRSLRGGDSEHFGTGIIKTVILPNEEINRLAVEAEELKQYLAAQRQVFEESISAFEKDRLIREQEFSLKEREFSDTLGSLRGRLEQRERVNYGIAKDFFDYKHVVGKTRQRLQDEYDLAQAENEALKNQLDKLLEAAKNETKYSEGLY